MPEFTAKILFADLRVITIEADTLEEAQAKYEAGEWDSEHSIDFYSLEEKQGLKLVKAKTRRA